MASKGPECSICFEGYNDKDKSPRLLSCGHSFCSCCLERLLRGNTIDCPKCRNPVAVPSGVHGLLKNFALLDMVNETAPKQHAENTGHTGTHECEACDEKHPAMFFCLDCKENMCKTAAQIHKRSKLSRDHRVLTFKELKANPQLTSVSVLCPEHNDQFRFFDENCGHVICRDCYALNHNGHKCVVVAEAASKYRQEMEALVTKASCQVEKIKVAEVQVVQEVLLTDGASVQQREKIQSFFRELHSALSNREQVLMDKVSSIHQQKKSILTEQLGRLRVNQTFLESVVQRAKSSIQSPSDVQFLLSRPDIVSMLETEESYSMVLEPEAQFLPEFTKEENWDTMTRTNKSIEEVIQNAGAINDNSTCAANTTAAGLGITTANPGRKVTFTITSRDSQNFQRKLGGDVFEVKLKPEVGGDDIKVELNDREDGTYLAEYTVDKLYGKLTLSVCLRGAHINGSPFSVLVEPPRPLANIFTVLQEQAQKPSGVLKKPLKPFGVLQEPPNPFGVLQEPPKPFGVLQEPPKPCGVLQEPPKLFGVLQEPTNLFGVLQEPPKRFDVIQEPTNLFGVLQEPPKRFDVIQEPTNLSGVLQEPPKPFGVLQEPPKPFGVVQEPPKLFGVLQEPPKPFGVLQEPPKPFGVLQEPPKPFGVLQEPPKPFGVLQEPPKLFGVLQEPPKLFGGNDVTGTSGLPNKIVRHRLPFSRKFR